MRPDLSVVIPSYQTQGTLRRALESLERQSGVEFEVIVVDCSPGDEVDVIVRDFPFASLQKEPSRFDPGKGRNLGVKGASGALVVFIDADVNLAPGSLAAALTHHREGKKVFGGALELDTAVHADFASYLEHYFFNHEAQASRPPCERANLSSALLCIDREVFLAAGGFRDIPRMQDTELTERLRSEGHTLFFCPDVLATQVQDAPLEKVLRKIYINGQNVYYIRYARRFQGASRGVLLLLTPAICTAKTARIVARHLRYQPPAAKLKALLLGPGLALGGLLWGAGLMQAVASQQGMAKAR